MDENFWKRADNTATSLKRPRVASRALEVLIF
jgi:hypothetical protein